MPRPLLTLAVLAVLLAPSALAQQAADWQQEVAYEMDIHLAADRHQMTGTQRLAYTNNSPDTLRQVYYHLYFNAFHPNSMMAERNRQLPDPDGRVVPRIFELGPDEVGWHRVRSLTQDGQPVEYRITDTILEVDLARPILPGETTVFEMAFESQVPLQTRRSGRDSREGIDFSMTQWYPKMAAYDAVGWHADPYVGREFYAPFGTFDVRLTLPSEYVVGASGTLQNPDEIGHGYDEAPDAGLTAGGPATDADSLTWHFRAERVHDFAWAADPDYRHARYVVNDVPGRDEPVELHLLYQPDASDAWTQLGEYTAEMTRFFSERIGPYAYPQFTVAQGGDGGMEYPMITLITGNRPLGSLVGVTAHEYVHMWFYGVIATNESDFSWMDEGFTSYMSSAAMHHLFERPGQPSYAGGRASVAQVQRLGLWERPNKPADWYETNTGFSVASYTGGAVLVDLLGYVMGDDVRDDFIQRYYDEFEFRHPYPADVQQVAQRTSGLQLDWLFEQYLDGEGRYDYGADDLDVEQTAEGYRHTITLRRHENGVLPVDLRLRYDDGSEHFVTVPPAVMHGHKPVPEGWTVAEPWPWTHPTYTLTHESPNRVVEVQVDPENRMLDLDPANNRIAMGGPDIPRHFAGFFAMPSPDRAATTYALSPIGLYSHDYGVGVGAQLRAVRPGDRGTLQLGVTLWPEVIADEDKGFDGPRTAGPPIVVPDLPEFPDLPDRLLERDTSPLDGIDYTAVYTRPLRSLGPLDAVRLDAQKHLGIMENRVSLTKALGSYPVLRDYDHTLTLTLGHQHRVSDRAFEAAYALLPSLGLDLLGSGSGFEEDHLLSARLDYRLGDDDNEIAAFAEVGGSASSLDAFLGLPSNANRLFVTATKTSGVGPFTGLARLALGVGADGLASQKRFGLGAASVESRWRSHAYRVLAAAPEAPQDDLHFFALSGVGPVAYLLREPAPLDPFDPFARRPAPVTGTRLVAGTLALRSGLPGTAGLDPTWRAVLAPLQFEVFSGVGALGLPEGDFVGDFVADAGFGVRYDVAALRLGRGLIAQSDVLSGLRLVAKFPVWASDPEFIGPDEDAFGLRWLVGIETAL